MSLHDPRPDTATAWRARHNIKPLNVAEFMAALEADAAAGVKPRPGKVVPAAYTPAERDAHIADMATCRPNGRAMAGGSVWL